MALFITGEWRCCKALMWQHSTGKGEPRFIWEKVIMRSSKYDKQTSLERVLTLCCSEYSVMPWSSIPKTGELKTKWRWVVSWYGESLDLLHIMVVSSMEWTCCAISCGCHCHSVLLCVVSVLKHVFRYVTMIIDLSVLWDDTNFVYRWKTMPMQWSNVQNLTKTVCSSPSHENNNMKMIDFECGQVVVGKHWLKGVKAMRMRKSTKKQSQIISMHSSYPTDKTCNKSWWMHR